MDSNFRKFTKLDAMMAPPSRGRAGILGHQLPMAPAGGPALRGHLKAMMKAREKQIQENPTPKRRASPETRNNPHVKAAREKIERLKVPLSERGTNNPVVIAARQRAIDQRDADIAEVVAREEAEKADDRGSE